MSVRESASPRAARGRAILHVDMDAFYASVEQHDDPRLAGKPLIVGGTNGRAAMERRAHTQDAWAGSAAMDGHMRRGVVAAASYEVRAYGVRSAMPMSTALERCPHAICVRPRMARYQEVSSRVFAIFGEVTPLVQGLSLDEAFLDVTADRRPPAEIGSWIKRRIRETTGLTASVGVACNKLVAKIASDFDKPDGLTVVEGDRVHEFLDPLSVRRLPGLGRKAGERVEALGLATLGELRRAPNAVLFPIFGRYAARVRERASGIDERPVEPDRDERSVSAEDTFERDISDPRALTTELERLADRACDRIRARQLAAGCIAVKIRRHDFATFTRQRVVVPATQDRRTVARIASELLSHWLVEHPGAKLRLLGVVLRSLCPATQLGLFESARPSADATVDAIRLRFGRHALRWGIEIK